MFSLVLGRNFSKAKLAAITREIANGSNTNIIVKSKPIDNSVHWATPVKPR
jgi:hypothetical protein